MSLPQIFETIMSLTENSEIKRLILYAYLEPKASRLALSKINLSNTLSSPSIIQRLSREN